MQDKVRQLDAQQTTSFDTECIDKGMFEVLTKQLNMLYPTQQPFHLLDVGGGNGMYADKILNHYPNAQVTLIKPEASLIAKNRPNPNKHLVCHLFHSPPSKYSKRLFIVPTGI